MYIPIEKVIKSKITPKYLSFSWINVNPIEKKLQENIIRIKEIMS